MERALLAFGAMVGSTLITVGVLAGVLVAFGVALTVIGIRLVRATRSDAAALGPLEVMSDRAWWRSDTQQRAAAIAGARPSGAEPLATVPDGAPWGSPAGDPVVGMAPPASAERVAGFAPPAGPPVPDVPPPAIERADEAGDPAPPVGEPAADLPPPLDEPSASSPQPDDVGEPPEEPPLPDREDGPSTVAPEAIDEDGAGLVPRVEEPVTEGYSADGRDR